MSHHSESEDYLFLQILQYRIQIQGPIMLTREIFLLSIIYVVKIHIPVSNTKRSYGTNKTFWKKEGSMNHAMLCSPRTGERLKINKKKTPPLLEGKELHANYPISPKSKILEFPFVLLWPGPQGVIRKTSINSKHDTLCHPVEIPIQTCTTSCNTFFEVSHYGIYPA